MRSKKEISVLFIAILAVAFVFGGAALTAYTQNQIAVTKESAIAPKPVAEVRPRIIAPTAGASNELLLATQQNTRLKADLNWVFGGKQQRGWYLYEQLIQQLISTDKSAETNDFAATLQHWQKGAGLTPSGILDNDTLGKMVMTWQGARIQDRSYPSPDQLLTAPIADFFDPTRPDELRQVERTAYAAYKRMVTAAAADKSLGLSVMPSGELAPAEKYLKIVSAFRSREYQEQLRRQSPNAGRAGLAVNSPHFTGRALDLYVGGDPVDTKDANRAIQVNTPVYKWLVKNAQKFGFYPYYYEPWHWEYKGMEK